MAKNPGMEADGPTKQSSGKDHNIAGKLEKAVGTKQASKSRMREGVQHGGIGI